MASSSDQALTTPSFARHFHHLRNPLLLSLSCLLSWLLFLQPSFLLSWWLFLLCFFACEPSLQLSLHLICYSSDSFCFCPALSFPCPCPSLSSSCHLFLHSSFCLFYHLFWFLCPFSCYHPLLFSVCFLMQIPPGSHSSSTRIQTPRGSEGIPSQHLRLH